MENQRFLNSRGDKRSTHVDDNTLTCYYGTGDSASYKTEMHATSGSRRSSFEDGVVVDTNTSAPEGKQKFAIGPLFMLAIAFNTCNSWAGVSGTMQGIMLEGGPIMLLYGMFSASGYLSIALVMGELASVYPTAGGQYHFASILAPRKWHNIIAYMCGFINIVTWLAVAASTVMLTATSILTLAASMNPQYSPTSWQLFLVYEAFSTSAILYNILAIKRTTWIHDVGCK